MIGDNSTTQLRWRFDVHAFRLLGRDLITDRVTALFELVKNSYDADATEVVVEFYNTKTITEHSKIIIRDNGEGMSLEDIENKWMVVGTNSKRTRTHSLKFNRRLVGEKGIGRFAVDKLGGFLKLRTKKENEQEISVTIDWGEYEKAAEKKLVNEQMILFTEMDNLVTYNEKTIETHGTVLEISNLHKLEIWSDSDLQRAYLELSKIVSPFVKTDNFFNIFIEAKEYSDYKEVVEVKSNEVKHYSDYFHIGFDANRNVQQVLHFDENTETIVVKEKKMFSFGFIELKLYHFNENAKKAFNTHYKKMGVYIDGIKIYRDGVVTTPFAETEFDLNKKRDVLGIDKRLWRGTFDKVGTREVIGFLDIKKENNPLIVDSTNRQDFIDNQAYRDLKKFIINQLEEIEKYKLAVRKNKIEQSEIELGKAEDEIDSLIDIIAKIEIDTPLLSNSPYFDTLKKQVKKAKKSVKTGKKQTLQFKEEALRKENIYISLMSLQDYAANIAHAVRCYQRICRVF
jgi:Histidine kinase-, DNA gyrase B-, and HSP90-like ATPase